MSTSNHKSDSGNLLASSVEQSAITKPSVAAGLGYPANRDEISPAPIGWQAIRHSLPNSDLIKIEN